MRSCPTISPTCSAYAIGTLALNEPR
jgi:hypothetical protein